MFLLAAKFEKGDMLRSWMFSRLSFSLNSRLMEFILVSRSCNVFFKSSIVLLRPLIVSSLSANLR